MRDLPTGTVTFLFTDMQGSTKLLQRLGPDFHVVREQHDSILRAAIGAQGGREISTEGDSFFAVFPTPRAAVAAAVQAQRELAAASWPGGCAVAVRMGVHTGEGIRGGDNYVGLDVNRAARIAAAGHGGQIVISEATRVMVDRDLPAPTTLRDLGEHRLKDLVHPERLHQVVIEGLAQEFPPLRSLDRVLTNLPSSPTRFIGRAEELALIRAMVHDHRLVTLTGPGGTGKTRLAVEAAREAATSFSDGVFFVDLAPLTDPELVPAAIADSLGLREEQSRALIDTLAAQLQDMAALLLLDNFEQVVDGAAVLDGLLAGAPRVRALVTSRIPLHVYGEREVPVPPLGLVDPTAAGDTAAVARSESVAMFVERATAVRPRFQVTPENSRVVAEITARLDGLPLAIELAASRLKVLSAAQLLARLGERLPLLSAVDRNIPERQQTLRRTIEWSYDLLEQRDQRRFRALSVFAGGADLAAVEAVVDPDARADALDWLTVLVDCNLVRRSEADENESEPRYSMLETIREYGLDQLREHGEEAAARRRHAQYWVEVTERAADTLSGGDQAEWTRRLERDHENLRAALGGVLRSGEPEAGLRIGVAAGEFWKLGSHVREGVRWLTDLLALPAASARTLLRARALSTTASLYGWLADPDTYLQLAQEALGIYQELDDRHGVADSVTQIGWAELQTGRLDAARATLERAMASNEALGRPAVVASAAMGLGLAATMQGRLDDARALLESALETFRQVHDVYFAGLTQFMIAGIYRAEGQADEALERIRAGLTAFVEIDNQMGIAWALYAFADAALLRGEPERALRLVGASDHLRGDSELPILMTTTMGDVGTLARDQLGEEAADARYREGAAMSLETAVAYARGDA